MRRGVARRAWPNYEFICVVNDTIAIIHWTVLDLLKARSQSEVQPLQQFGLQWLHH